MCGISVVPTDKTAFPITNPRMERSEEVPIGLSEGKYHR